MKAKEREEARRLRAEEGLSIGDIAKRLGISKGTSSLWLREVSLSEEQKMHLSERGKNGGSISGENQREKAKDSRKRNQEEGRALVRNGVDVGYHLLCSLYWAEGNKDRCCVGMTNTDVEMLRFFVNGMKKYFGCKDEDFNIRVMAHLNNGLTEDKIHEYWLKELGLPLSCLRKFILKSKYYPVQNKKKNLHIYGGCTVKVNSTEIVQKIYGSIQEIFRIERPEWLW